MVANLFQMATFIKKFSEISNADVSSVGGKNASLGEMFTTLGASGIQVPDGFATTADAFSLFLNQNNLRSPLRKLMEDLDRVQFSNLKQTGTKARELILKAKMPDELAAEIVRAYRHLGGASSISVAIRSSATAEDLPNASFAGQHESYLNVTGEADVVRKIQHCYASLYTDRAIKYREDNGFDHATIALSAGVQKMVRSDKACSGIGFTLEPESGFKDIIHLSGVWGLGENIVQGTVTPDEFYIFKPTLESGKYPIIQKKLGTKEKTLVYSDEQSGETTVNKSTSEELRDSFVLSDEEVLTIARWALVIEQHYNKRMDIEWAKDGISNQLYIIQARPETVHSQRNQLTIKEYRLKEKGALLTSGQAVGSKIATGVARILDSATRSDELKQGEILVTDNTTPDWDPILKKAAAIITNKGGRTSHASIVARELGVPAVVGTGNATSKITNGQTITVSCSEGTVGNVYSGKLNYEETDIDTSDIKMPQSTEAMLIVADPGSAFNLSFYPNDGVGLMRLEFIITHEIGIHPMALVKFDELQPESLKQQIAELTKGYADKKQFFVDKLSQGIATIAAAFYPKDVIVRMSDFKSNEYANLLGGHLFEPKEENPMIGFRGASRYYSPLYKQAFSLECEALKIVRYKMGLMNVKAMIPFCRTPEEGTKVINVMKEFGLDRSKDDTLEIYVMAEIPSNILQAEDFAAIFDGFSIGSNDLTQLTLGVDRDSSLVADLFNEENDSSMQMISTLIQKAKSMGIKVGLCGQAPSDFPGFARFLVREGINSISFNPDALLKGIQNINKAEENMPVMF